MNLTRILVSTKNLLVKQGASIKALLRYSSNIAFEDIPNVSPSQIKLVLKKHNISYDEGFTNFIISCPSCQTGTNVKRCMYINKTTGMYLCASCHTTGQWSSIQEIMTKRKPHVNAATEQSELKVMKQILEQIRENTNPIHVLDEQSRKHVLSYLMENSFSSTTSFSFGTLDVRIDSTKRNIYFPLENALSEVVGYKVLDTVTKKESALPSSMCTGILTSRHLRNKDAAIVVPYLKDFLVLLNGKISASIVCLTNGLTHLPQHVLPSLERFKKLILWFGNDSMSWESARLFAKKLGEKRCLFIRPTEQHSLPHLVDSTKDLKSIIASAQPMWHKSITTFSNLREDVLFDLHNFDQVQGIKWKRFPSLNKILKGHRRGELTVITGPTGCGKTTFISEYSLDLAQQGVNTLWGSFEITNSRLARTMLQQLAGIPLEEHLDQFNYWADQFELLPIYFLTFHGQQSLKVVMEAVEHATYIHDISHVIIDNLQFMMGMVDDERNIDRFWRQDAIVAAFRMFATRKNCHVTLVIHPRKERTNEDLTASSIFGGAKASQEADNVLLIQDKRLVSVRGKKYLQVVKNRYTGDLGVMPMEFDKSGLSYAQKKKKAAEQKEETGPITS